MKLKSLAIGAFLTFILSHSAFAQPHELALGDSITYGVAASVPANAYINILARDLGVSITNKAVSGDQAADQAIAAHPLNFASLGFMRTTADVILNDCVQYGASATEQGYFKAFLTEIIVNATTPGKVNGRDAAMTKTGTWINTSPVWSDGVYSNTLGDIASASINGSVAYIGTTLQVYMGTGVPGTANVYADVVNDSAHLIGSFSTNGVGMNTQNGPAGQGVSCCFAPAAFRFPIPSGAGPHTIYVVKTSLSGGSPVPGLVYVEYIAGNQQTSPMPVFVSNSTPIVGANVNNCTPALIPTYNAIEASLVSTLAGDGLPVTQVDNSGLLASDISTTNYPHPNDSGHAKMAANFFAAISGPPPPPPTWTWAGMYLYQGTPSGGGSQVYCAAAAPPSGACPLTQIVP